jgi:hypothetical protein
MTTAANIDDLPDSDFAYIEPGGTKDSSGRTVPRSLRHFPIQDEAHVRNALARLSQSPFGDKARAKVEAAAKRMGIGAPAGKATGELKAEPMNTTQLDAWLSGRIPRRILVLPFGGPIPKAGAPRGSDLDGEWFDENTDITHGHKALIESRERVVDWHHRQDPTGLMKGAILGHVLMDTYPEDEGIWADFWANAGEKRRDLIARLERGGVPLYGSSEAAYKKADMNGHIDVWPLIRHTITTSPQNTYAVLPPLKAFLTVPSIDELPADALKALLVGLDASTTELLLSSPSAAVTASALAGGGAVKSGRVLSTRTITQLRAAIELLGDLIAQGALVPEEPTEE